MFHVTASSQCHEMIGIANIFCSIKKVQHTMGKHLLFLLPDIRMIINTLKPRRNKSHFVDDIFKRIFLNEDVLISIQISLEFIPNGPISYITALVQIMAWRLRGDKPLSEPMMITLLICICVTRSHWVNCYDRLRLRLGWAGNPSA